jgi:wobble nucleotide-excising tRNase
LAVLTLDPKLFPLERLRLILAQNIEGVAVDAEQSTIAHLAAHGMRERGQSWLSEGLTYIENNRCPFCNQSLENAADWIRTYRLFFSEGFRRLRADITDLQRAVRNSLHERDATNFERTIEQNATPLDKPSFKNTLSAGDKSTLALAFFLAQLTHDPDKAKKIVVFDDPFNSQDSFRKDCTIQKIKKCGQECAQVIVLSHDPYFLKRIWDRVHTPSERKCLEMARIGKQNTTICEWDVEKATQAQYKADRNALRAFYLDSEGESRDVVQKIRPVLESYCRHLGGDGIVEDDTLGTMIGKIRTSGPGHQLHALCEDLDELNEYTNRYHHGNPDAAVEPINDTELQGYVRRTLEMTGGC